MSRYYAMDRKIVIYALIVVLCFIGLYVTSEDFKTLKIFPVEYTLYSDNGINFKYPKEWKLNNTPQIINYPDYKIESIATLSKAGSETLPLTFSVFLVDENVTDDEFKVYLNSIKTASYNLISTRNLTINGQEAYEQVERLGDGQIATIYFMKDGKQFEIRLFVPDGLYPKNKNIESIRIELNTITESFKITNSSDINLNIYLKQKEGIK